MVDKLVKNSKVLNKNLQSALKELVVYEAQKFKNLDPKPKYYSLHRKEAEPDFMINFLREINNATDTFLFLSTGDEKTSGNILLFGEEKAIADLGNKYVFLFVILLQKFTKSKQIFFS